MRCILALLFIFFAHSALAQSEEEGMFQLNQNALEPGKTPVYDERLAPINDGSGIILPQENKDLPLEAAIVFRDKKKSHFISKNFIFGFFIGGVLIAFTSFFMLKFAKKSLDP